MGCSISCVITELQVANGVHLEQRNKRFKSLASPKMNTLLTRFQTLLVTAIQTHHGSVSDSNCVKVVILPGGGGRDSGFTALWWWWT